MRDIDGLDWISYYDFSGGENVDADPDNLQDNECEKIENLDPSYLGGFETRGGCSKVNSSSYTAQVEQIFDWDKIDGNVQLMAVIGTDMCKVASNGTRTVIQALNASAKKCFWFPFQSSLYFGDGYKYFIYNGTSSAEVMAAAGADLTFVKGCKFAVWHAKSYRWLFAGNSTDKFAVAYSESNEPNNVKAISKLYPTHGMGEITGLKSFGDAIIVFYKRGARIWRGIDPEIDVEWQEIPIPEGSLSNDAACLAPGSMPYLGCSGWWSLPPSILNYSYTLNTANDIVPNIAFGKQTKTVRDITKFGRPDLACSVYDKTTGFVYLAYTKTAGETRNSRVLVNRWGTRTFWHYTGWQVNDWLDRSNGDLLFASNNYIYKANTGGDDAGTAIDQKLYGKRHNFGTPNNHKTVGKFIIKSGPVEEKSTADIQVKSASSSRTNTNVSLQTVRLWSDPWDSPWSSTDNKVNEINFDPSLLGREFQVRITNNQAGEGIMVYGYGFGSVPSAPIGDRI